MDHKIPRIDASMLERLETLFRAALMGKNEATAEEMLALTAHAMGTLGHPKPPKVTIMRGIKRYKDRATVLPFRRP